MDVIATLRTLVDPRDVLTTAQDIAYAAIDQASSVTPCMPRAVVRVASTEQLIRVVQYLLAHHVPVVARAAGTGKSGGAVGTKETVIVDTKRLNRILHIDQNNFLAEVEPGVILKDLQDAVMALGLYYPPDPASYASCTIGGNVAENAAGPSTVKYGTTRDYLLGGQAIIGTGELIDFGKRCVKGVVGYDIASLLCGSEGTLAIFTKLILRLLPYPQSHACAIFWFDDDESALNAVPAILARGHLPTTLEYVDTHSVQALKKIHQLPRTHAFAACLIIECDAAVTDAALASITDIKNTLGAYGLRSHTIFATRESIATIWHMRSQLSAACAAYLGKKVSEDIAVPLGALSEFRSVVMSLSKPPHVQCALFGHAGDGNLHVQIMFDHDEHRMLALSIRHEILLAVVRLGGTLSAEHGIGLQKKSYLHLEQAPALIELQKRIKRAFDPKNLVNPGKIFPE